jgi:hypothetical protein
MIKPVTIKSRDIRSSAGTNDHWFFSPIFKPFVSFLPKVNISLIISFH